MGFYTEQGVNSVYIPIIGASTFIFRPSVPRKNVSESQVEFYKSKKDSPKGMIVSNTFDSINPTLFLTNR
jgi:hypothetical protein